ncbi:MAG TPA: MFS transporter [Pseudonocardia sp.]|uniref:MFS transporter n=1 Tax=Pseudonocardia sp. TaxID=60912 RepID=UPI002B79FE3F|nr:MFS transporter [Pseudonocardia sp.]HTF46953.1 MFS transporter [Pseudonocardia sp.]
MRGGGAALLIAFGIDNFGSGLFLPLTLVYATQVVGLTVAQSGLAVTIGTLAGLFVPAVAGSLVDRVGARPVVIAAQLLQAVGVGTYLLAHGMLLVVAAALLLGAGQQLFYSALFGLIADTAGDGPTDRAFTVVAMVRGATFALGALVVGALLSTAGPAGYRWGIAADALSFVVAAAALALGLRAPGRSSKALAKPTMPPSEIAASRVWRDCPYLALIAVTMLFALSLDFFLVGVPVYTLEVLGSPPWLPGALLALITVIGSTMGTLVLRWTTHWSRIKAVQIAAIATALWCATSAAAVLLPAAWRTGYLLGCAVLLAGAQLVSTGRINALAEAAAPPDARARYLAAFQYAFTIAGVLAPAVVALFSVTTWLPWLVVAAGTAASAAGLRYVRAHLPAHALGIAHRG